MSNNGDDDRNHKETSTLISSRFSLNGTWQKNKQLYLDYWQAYERQTTSILMLEASK